MIEPDINERMARFAPSQNMGDPGDDAIKRAVASMAKVPTRPEVEQDDAIHSAVLQMASERKQDMAASLMAASQVNPDQAARASRLGEQFGVGQDIALRNMQELERESAVRDIQRMDLMRNDPVLARYLSDRAFASEAQDDVGMLAMLQPLFMEAAMIQARGAPALFDAVSRGYQRGKKQMELGEMQALQMVRYPTPQERDDMANLTKEIQELGRGGAIGTGAEMIGQYAANLKEIAAYSTVGAAIGSAIPGAGTAAGGALGLAAGLLKTTGTTAAGKLYNTLYEKGVPDDVAIPAAIAGGFFSGLVEVVGGKIAAMPVQSLAKRVMAETLSEALARPTLQQAAKEFVKAYGLQVGGETFEEGTQAISDMLSEEIALAASGIDSELTLRQGFMTVIESALYGAAGSAILGGIGPGANLLVDLRRASNTERQTKVFEDLTTNRKESKYANRNPVGYERLLAAQAEEASKNGEDITTTYIRGDVATSILQQSGVPVKQLEDIVPNIRQQLAEIAEGTRSDLTLPTATFGAKLAGTKLGDAFLPHVRIIPNGWSQAETAAWNQNKSEEIESARQILAQKQESDGTFVAEAREIYNDIRRQAMEAGQDSDTADVAASLYQAFVVTQAAGQNIKPAQFQAQQGVRGIEKIIGGMPVVQGEQAAASVAALEQANRDIIASVDAELGGIMDAAKEASRAAGKTKSKNTQAAAFKAKQEWISANQERYAEYQAAQRIDALERERIREAAASSLAGKIDESIATAAKTLTDAGFVLDYESPAPSKSRYYSKGNTLIRLSDHEIPVTPERAAAREAGVRPPYRDFVFDGTAVDAERIQDLEAFAARTSPDIMRQAQVLEQAAISRMDADYMAAVERGDMETAQRMVDEAARAAGYNVVAYHGTDAEPFTIFGDYDSYYWGKASYFSPNREYAEMYSDNRTGKGFSRVMRVNLKLGRVFSPETNPEHLAMYRKWTREQRKSGRGGPFFVGGPMKGKYGPDKVRNVIDYEDQWWLVGRIWDAGFDAFTTSESDGQTIAWGLKNPNQVKLADPVTYDESGNVVPLSRRFDITSPRIFEQAAAGPARGGIDIRRMVIMLTEASDRTTLWHEFVHFFLHMYTEAAVSGRASERQLNDLDLLLKWFKIEGNTPAERLANWNAMTLDQKRKHHEALTYNAEIYAFEGKAPSAELVPVFERLRSFMLRVYKSIRDDLNAIYRREFGEDLPILTGEVRQVMDRMLATDEQIKRQAAINEMKPQFQTQEQSGMDDAEWAAYQAMQQEAIEASVTDMNKASMRQLQWLGNARSRILRDMQRKHEAKRKEVAAEVAAAVRVEPLYRAMTYLRTGKFIDTDGAEVVVEGPHRLDIKRVQAIYAGLPSEKDMEAVRATGQAMPKVFAPDIAKLGTGKYGMLGVDGLDPDVVAESFGYSSGDQMIRALLEAKPIKEEVAERTDAEMLRRFGDMNTPEAQEAEVQKALHNEARARFVAVELRHIARATQPVRVMLEAAKQVARELIAGMTLRDVRPGDFIAAEARAARDASRMGATVNPEAVGQAAQTRAYNEAIAAGTDPAEAMAASIEKGAEAARKAQERSDALKAQYGADPQQALVRASRAQLYQNQLAAQALVVREEVAKQVKYLRRIMRDTNVKAMGAQAADQIAALLERFEVAPVSLKRLDERKALAEWLAQQAELGLVPDIAPEIVNEARRVNYQQLTVAEFRDLVDAIRQIEHIGKRERKAAQEKLRAEFNALKDEAIQSMKDVAAKRGRKARKELGDEDRKWAQLIAGYDAMQQTIGNILYVLDGGQRDGPLARMLLFTANDAGNQEATDRANATLALSKILDPIKRKGQFSARKLYFRQIDDSLSLEQRMVIALNYGNQSNIDRLLNGEKWTDEQVQVILQSLTEEQLNAVQAIWDYLQSFKPRVSAQERNLLGRDPTWIELRPFTVQSADGKVVNMAGGYYPAKYNPRRSSMSREMDESVEADRQMYEAMTAATTTRSYTKNRQNRPPEGGVLSRQMSGLYAGINEVIHDLAWRTWAMDANRLLRDKEFQTVINSIYGRETYSAIKNWVDATVRGERGNYDVIENIAIGVRRNVSVSAMGLKFVTAAIQVTGLIPATVRTGITPMVRAVAYFAANPRESSRIAREKSSFMRNRGKTRYRDLNEIANIVRGESRARRAYLANAYALIGLQQGMVDMSVWWASYSKAIKEGKPEDVAVSIADQTVIDTQGSGMLKDLSQAMRGGQKQSAYAKLFTSFYQFSNTQYSLLSAQLRTAPSMGKAAADAFAILVVGAFFEEMLRTLLKPSPEDEEPEKLAKALIANQIDFVIGLPFGGGELRGIGDIIVGEQAMQYRGPSGLRMVGEARTFAGQTLQGEFDRAWTRSAINMSGLIWGIPSAQINDTIDGIEAAVEGEVEGVEAALAPITGVRR